MSTSPVPLVVRRVINAPREKVFDAFSQASALAKWFTPSPEVFAHIENFDFNVGGKFDIVFEIGDGRAPHVCGSYEVIERPLEIAMTWVWQAPDALANIPMHVTFEFVAVETAMQSTTEVIVTHNGIPSHHVCTVHEAGWQGTLAQLDQFLR